MVEERPSVEPGMMVRIEVTGHQRWGLDVRLLPPHECDGVVDIINVTDLDVYSAAEPFMAFDNYPPLGTQLDAVVLGYTPTGQLRLSARDSDVSQARRRQE